MFIVQLICAFVLAYAKSRFSHEAAHLSCIQCNFKTALSFDKILHKCSCIIEFINLKRKKQQKKPDKVQGFLMQYSI